MPIDYKLLTEQLEAIAADPSELRQDEPTRIRLLLAMQRALPEVEKFQDTCQRLMLAPLELTAAQLGCDLKLFETLAAAKAPMSTDQLATKFGANAPMLDRLLKYMASLAMIREVGPSTWHASRVTHTLAQPTAAAGVFHYFDTVGPGMLALPQWLKDHKYQPPLTLSDTPWSSAHGNQDIIQWIVQHPSNLESAELYMTIHRLSEGAWINSFPSQQVEAAAKADASRTLFVDVAGGFGQQCKAVLAKHPDWAGRVVLEDLPPVIEKAPPIKGVEAKGIDMLTDQPVKGAFVYYMRSVLHDWPDAQCLTILAHIKAAMSPDSLLLIDESVVPAQGAHKISMQIDLVMLLSLASEERSEQHWHELLQKAGFKIARIHRYHDQVDDGLIVATIA